MKLWISVDKPFEASNYKIISPLDGNSPFDIDKYVDNNEATEIVLDNILGYIPVHNIQPYINKVIGKLAHKGQLIVNDIDALQVVKDYYYGQISIVDFNNLLYGGKTHSWDFKQSCVTLNEISHYINQAGLRTIQKRLPHLHYSIIAERP